jgi:DNA-directed RNA polymerase subunit RPC12/RpoP
MKAKFRFGMRRVRPGGFDKNRDFQCSHCGAFVSANPALSGVVNRNHCPYCLWSRHLDLHRAGDRLSACKAVMQPIGVTFKKANKKYGTQYGELMLVHQCTDCGRIALNRIAADDDRQAIFQVCERALSLDPALRLQLLVNGIAVIEAADLPFVETQLAGWN